MLIITDGHYPTIRAFRPNTYIYFRLSISIPNSIVVAEIHYSLLTFSLATRHKPNRLSPETQREKVEVCSQPIELVRRGNESRIILPFGLDFDHFMTFILYSIQIHTLYYTSVCIPITFLTNVNSQELLTHKTSLE